MDSQVQSPQTTEDIKWNTLTQALHNNRCVLFLGPFLPVYALGSSKVDFNSLVSLRLSEEMIKKKDEFDQKQSQNLSYIAQKYISLNNNYRPQLHDEISKLFNDEVAKMQRELNDSIPALYKTILHLPWHTIVNMQPDNFFEKAMKPNEVFSYYNYKAKEIEIKVNEDQFLVYNLFGTLVKEKAKYNLDSIVLTEEDQVEFIRNVVSGNPKVPDAIISRFDNNKIYLFLDCNLENWYFRLLMEILKIHKDSHTFSPKPNSLNFSAPTLEFYKKRYGFVFINNNSEEFINQFKQKYDEAYPTQEHVSKKIFIAYHDSSEEFARSLIYQFEPWVEKKELTIWTKEDILPGEDPVKAEQDQFNNADVILLLVNARFLGEAGVSAYVKPAVEAKNSKKVFAVIESACPWDESPINNLYQQLILPTNRIPIKLQQQQDPDKIIYEVVKSITSAIWE